MILHSIASADAYSHCQSCMHNFVLTQHGSLVGMTLPGDLASDASKQE